MSQTLGSFHCSCDPDVRKQLPPTPNNLQGPESGPLSWELQEVPSSWSLGSSLCKSWPPQPHTHVSPNPWLTGKTRKRDFLVLTSEKNMEGRRRGWWLQQKWPSTSSLLLRITPHLAKNGGHSGDLDQSACLDVPSDPAHLDPSPLTCACASLWVPVQGTFFPWGCFQSRALRTRFLWVPGRWSCSPRPHRTWCPPAWGQNVSLSPGASPPLSLAAVVQLLSRVRLFVTPWTADTRLPRPLPSPGVCSNSSTLSQWRHPTISSFVIPFSFCLQSSPAWGSFPMNFHFTLFLVMLHLPLTEKEEKGWGLPREPRPGLPVGEDVVWPGVRVGLCRGGRVLDGGRVWRSSRANPGAS